MLRVVPVGSPLAEPREVERITAAVLEQSDANQWQVKIQPEFDAADPSPVVFLVTTGGTEKRVLELSDRWDGPVVLLAHATHNSLPASLEILARLDQLGRRGRIVLARRDASQRTSLAACVTSMKTHAKLRGQRLGLIGTPSDWLVASSPDAEAIRAQWGVELIQVPMSELDQAINAVPDRDAEVVASNWKENARGVVEPTSGDLMTAARVVAALREVVRKHRLDACSVRCFDLVTGRRTTGCIALSELIDDGVMAGCEGDLPATLTMMWMHAMTGERPFLANPQDVSLDNNTLWLAHCTIARTLVRAYRLRSHFESSLGVGIEGELEPGPATLARIGGMGLDKVFVSDAEMIGPESLATRCRTQVRLRLKESVEPLLSRPLGNHHVLVRGQHARMLREYAALYLGQEKG